jgi:hypothetical protein
MILPFFVLTPDGASRCVARTAVGVASSLPVPGENTPGRSTFGRSIIAVQVEAQISG